MVIVKLISVWNTFYVWVSHAHFAVLSILKNHNLPHWAQIDAIMYLCVYCCNNDGLWLFIHFLWLDCSGGLQQNCWDNVYIGASLNRCWRDSLEHRVSKKSDYMYGNIWLCVNCFLCHHAHRRDRDNNHCWRMWRFDAIILDAGTRRIPDDCIICNVLIK